MARGDPWGSGLKLTRDWDLQIDETGDLKSVFGLEELEKDLAFRTAIEIEQEIGQILTKNTLAEIRITFRQALNEDVRVNRVVNVVAEQVDTNEVRVSATVVSDDGQEYDLTENFEV